MGTQKNRLNETFKMIIKETDSSAFKYFAYIVLVNADETSQHDQTFVDWDVKYHLTHKKNRKHALFFKQFFNLDVLKFQNSSRSSQFALNGLQET